MQRSFLSVLRPLLGAALALLLSATAHAYKPDVEVVAVCDVSTGITSIHYTASAPTFLPVESRSNDQVDVLFDNVLVDVGAFVAPDFSYSGSKPVPDGKLPGDTVAVRINASGTWGDGTSGGNNGRTRVVTIPADCAAPPEPAIEICTLVTLNPDMVSNFSDADAITGDSCDEFNQAVPVGVAGMVDGTYRLKVTNSGDEDLIFVLITAPDFGLFNQPVPCNGGAMAAGEMCIIDFGDLGFGNLKVPNVCTAPGQVNKIATVDGVGVVSGIEVTDDDPAAVNCTVEPNITIRKEVSLDGGPFLDANTADTGPSGAVGADATYRLVVENDGTETLVNAVITDNTLGLFDVPVPGGDLAPGDIRVITDVDAGFSALHAPGRCDSIGEKLNVARVDATGNLSDIDVASEDPAWVSCEEPQIELLKQVSLDGANFFDADNAGDPDVPVGIVGATDATYRFIVTNIGSEALTNVLVEDATLGISTMVADLGVGETRIIESGDSGFGSLYQPLRCGGTPGNKSNVASVAADGVNSGAAVSDDDPANVRCITGPEIQLLKQVSIDGTNFFDADTAATGPTGLVGADALYRMIVRNIGDEDLVDVTIDDSTLFIDGQSIPDLAVGDEVIVEQGSFGGFEELFYPNRCDSVGTVLNIAQVNASGALSGLPVMDDDPANLNCEAPLVCDVTVDKTCLVEPTVGDDLLCTESIASTTLRYTGPDVSNATVIFEGKDSGYAEYNNVDLVSGVTVLTSAAQNGYTIDSEKLGSKTTISINGVEEIIHTSCSAIYSAGAPAPLDGNTPNPANSEKGDPSPNWFVVNFRQKDGVVVAEETGPDADGFDACVVPFGGANVHFAYKVTNTGTTAMDLTSVLDSMAGEQLDNPPVELAPGEMLSLTGDPMFVDTLTMMSVDVTANVTGAAASCGASDTVVISVEPAPQLTCKELKPVTALSIVWNGPDGVDVVTANGQAFNNVQNGNQITFNSAGLGNDVEIFLSGAVSGSSVFHVSCSDDDMNGPEDCGSPQGNGKKDESDWINNWLLDGMLGAEGQFSCGLPNTGVVEPEDGGPIGGGDLTATVKDIKGKEYKIDVENMSGADATIVRMTISWPDATNGFLHEVKVGKDKIYHEHNNSSPLTITTWEKSADKRKIKKGKKTELKLKFDDDADKSASNYSVEIEFDNGTVITVQ